MPSRAVRILLIGGSTRAASTNAAALRAASARSGSLSATTYDGLAGLPAFNPDDDHEPLPPAVVELRAQIEQASGVLFCTPEYAGTLPGSLKNLLDWTVGGGEIYRKPVAWINVAPEGRGDGALATLATVLGYVGADVVESACQRVTVLREALGADGEIVDPAVRARIQQAVALFARRLREPARASERAPVYRADPHAAPDADFEPGRLAHLVAGNRGCLLDARRTPVSLAGVDGERGTFELVVEGFEDAGARWWLPLGDVSRFQFERAGQLLDDDRARQLAAVEERLDRPYELAARAEARARTERELARERALLRERLGARGALANIDLAACVAARRGSQAAQAELEQIMRERGLAELERAFAQTYVSNPASGEVVKGHAIVLAEMGLCPFAGTLVRDPGLFDGAGARERRRAHILARLAFLAELTALLGADELELYRAIAGEAELGPARPASLLAASFSREVAMAHFDGGPATRFALVMRQRVPAGRLFMSFLETAAMSGRYAEAEAVLIGAPGAALF